MPARHHRGSAPEDGAEFGADERPRLARATAHFSWLLSRGYADASALKLVGDRFRLTARQRLAVGRAACPDEARARRRRSEVAAPALAGAALHVDGFNVLTTVESALGGAALFLGRDGCLRDLAGLHGTWRVVAETAPAAELVAGELHALGVARCRVLLDRPVSNSGRLKQVVAAALAARGVPGTVEVVPDPDRVLCACDEVVASADRAVLDACAAWFNLARHVVDRHVPAAWTVDLSGSDEEDGGAA